MEQVRDLNIEADDMQVVLSAISGVSKRIKEVAQTHKPLFGGEHFLTGKEVCEKLYISPRTLQDYRDKRIIPYTQFAGKILYKTSDLEWLLEEKYKVQAGEYSLYLIGIASTIYFIQNTWQRPFAFIFLLCMKRRKLYENLQINTNLPRNREKNSIDGTYGHIHVKTNSHEYAQRSISVHFTAV